MAEFVSNCPVSWPIPIPGLQPDVDFGGMMFSYRWGLMFAPSEPPSPLRQPVS